MMIEEKIEEREFVVAIDDFVAAAVVDDVVIAVVVRRKIIGDRWRRHSVAAVWCEVE